MRSKNDLAKEVSFLEVFNEPNKWFEQHPTPSQIAAETLWDAKEELENKTILDLGAGTGILGIGALLLRAKHVTFIEKDEKAIVVLQKNLQKIYDEFDIPGTYKIIHANIELTDEEAEVVLMNPPFGTRVTHADKDFLNYAIAHANYVVSFHKANTIAYLANHISRLGGKILDKKEYKFQLNNTMDTHKKEKEYIDVVRINIEVE